LSGCTSSQTCVRRYYQFPTGNVVNLGWRRRCRKLIVYLNVRCGINSLTQFGSGLNLVSVLVSQMFCQFILENVKQLYADVAPAPAVQGFDALQHMLMALVICSLHATHMCVQINVRACLRVDKYKHLANGLQYLSWKAFCQHQFII
jgi:hypothetical protein